MDDEIQRAARGECRLAWALGRIVGDALRFRLRQSACKSVKNCLNANHLTTMRSNFLRYRYGR